LNDQRFKALSSLSQKISRLAKIKSKNADGQSTFSMLVSELECLNQSEDLIDRTPNWQIIDGYLTQNSLDINYEQTSETQQLHNNNVYSVHLHPASVQLFLL